MASQMSQAPIVAPPWFRRVCIGFVIMFLAFAGLQVNDPDPVRWIAIYGSTAIVTSALHKRMQLYPLALLVAAIAAVWCGVLLGRTINIVGPGDFFARMSEKGGAVEEAREAGGLAIAFLWLSSAATVARRKLANSSP